jgi:hypothetical protein
MNSPATGPSSGKPLMWILRGGTAACFIGHGALGLIGSPAWVPYFAVAGIGKAGALALMPWIGAFDIALAVSVLLRPVRGVILYMALWAIWTAFLRPLAGESVWEAVERAGNYGTPLALFLVVASSGAKDLWRAGFCPEADLWRRQSVSWVLRLTTFLLLAGHGALGLLVRKPMFAGQYALVGLPGSGIEPLIGGLECVLAFAALLRPVRPLLLCVAAWKLTSEAICPLAGASLWVFVEHGGSYAAPLALACLCQAPAKAPAALPLTAQSQPQTSARD